MTTIIQTNITVIAPCTHQTVTQSQIDACYGVSSRSAKDIVTKHRGRVIQ